MGLFNERSPSKGKERGRHGPWPRPARVRVSGASLAPPWLPPLASPWPPPPGSLGRGQDCTPPPYITEGLSEGESTTIHEPLLSLAAALHLLAANLLLRLFLSLSLSRVASQSTM
jgi:hypothetical protein